MMDDRKAQGALIIIATCLLLALPASTYLLIYPVKELPLPGPDLSSIAHQLAGRTSSSLSGSPNLTAEEMEVKVASELPGWITAVKGSIDGFDLSIAGSKINVFEERLPLGAVYPPAAITDKDLSTSPNSLSYGASGSPRFLPVRKVETELALSISPADGSDPYIGTVKYTATVVDPRTALLALARAMESDMNGWGSGLARDVEYMLNALVRMRAGSGTGSGPEDTEPDLLNEGDVELAVNFALMLRIARWTGSLPEGLSKAMDRYYSELDLRPVMNPTGARYWGEAERSNFEKYTFRSSAATEPRRASMLGEGALENGHADTADLFLRYLFMDRGAPSGARLDPFDMRGPLKELKLLNPRQTSETIDPMALEHHPSYPTEGGLELPGTFDSLSEETTLFHPDFELRRDYLVVNRDIRVNGLYGYKAWYTNADLQLRPEDLVNTGRSNGRGDGDLTRCGAIPPPPKPPNHDHRVQWDLDISGRLELLGSASGFGGSVLPSGDVLSALQISFPVRVYTWFGRDPNEDAFDFKNINKGIMDYTPISTGWVITPEANATEYFEKYSFQPLRRGFQISTSLLRSMAFSEILVDGTPQDTGPSSDLQAASALASLKRWFKEKDVWTGLGLLWTDLLQAKMVPPEDLGEIRVDGHSIALRYSTTKGRMDLISTLPEGGLRLSISKVSGGQTSGEVEVATPKGTKVVLDIDEGTYTIQAKDSPSRGSGSPKAPSDKLSSLLLGGRSKITSPSMTLQVMQRDSPIVDIDSGIPVEGTGPAVSLMMAGYSSGTTAEHIEALKRLWALAGEEREGSLTSMLYHFGRYSSQAGGWAGISAAWQGENGSVPMVRTIWVRSGSPELWNGLLSSGELDGIVLGTLWSNGIQPSIDARIAAGSDLDIICLVEIPAWAFPLPLGTTSPNIAFASHQSFLGESGASTTSSWAFYDTPSTGSPYEQRNDAWLESTIDGFGPLW